MGFFDNIGNFLFGDSGEHNKAAHPLDMNAGNINTANEDQVRQQQMGLIQQLQNQSNGTGGPSLAQGQLQQATDANNRNAMSLGQSQVGQGMSNQAALMNIGQAQANNMQQAAGQSAQQRMLEQMQAQQQLQQMLGGTRGQDLGLASNQAQNNMGMQQMQSGQDFQYANMNNQNRLANNAAAGNFLGGIGQMAETYATKGKAHGGEIGTGPDDPANDTVPAMLSPGEVVLPLSVTQAEDAPERAKKFLEAIMKSRGAKK